MISFWLKRSYYAAMWLPMSLDSDLGRPGVLFREHEPDPDVPHTVIIEVPRSASRKAPAYFWCGASRLVSSIAICMSQWSEIVFFRKHFAARLVGLTHDR